MHVVYGLATVSLIAQHIHTVKNIHETGRGREWVGLDTVMSNPGAARTPTTRDIIFQKVLLSHGRKRSHKESWTKRTQAKRKKPAVKGRKKEQCQQQQVHAENPLELPVSIVVEQSVKEVRQNVEKEVVELFKSQVTRSQGRQGKAEKINKWRCCKVWTLLVCGCACFAYRGERKSW